MKTRPNPLLADRNDPAVDLVALTTPTIHRRPLAIHRRELRDVRRAENAAEAIGAIDRKTEIYGFTKGQFSVVDIIRHCLATTGPARLQISTWTAANADITTVLDLVDEGTLSAARWLVDVTFNKRSPELALRIRTVFGDDAIRVAKNHAKFFLLDTPGPDGWRIVGRTSMNLNFNPRFENFTLAHDPELWDFHDAILTGVWNRQPRRLQDLDYPTMERHFLADL